MGINGSAFSFRKSRCVRFFLRELYWGNQGQSKGGRRKPDRARPSAAACDGQTSAAQDSAFLFSAGPPHLPPGAGPTPVPTWSRSVQVGKHQCSFLPGALNRRPLYPTPLPTSIPGGAWGALPSWRRGAVWVSHAHILRDTPRPLSLRWHCLAPGLGHFSDSCPRFPAAG